MIYKIIRVVFLAFLGFKFIQSGLNWSKDELFSVKNTKALISTGIKKDALIQGDFRSQINVVPKIGNIKYFFQVGEETFDGKGIDTISTKQTVQILYLPNNPKVNCINSEANINNLLKNEETYEYNLYFIMLGALFIFLSLRVVYKVIQVLRGNEEIQNEE